MNILGLLVNYVEETDAIKGATLNSSKLKSMFVPLPPLSEQARIVAEIEKFEPLIAEYDKLEQQATKLDTEIYGYPIIIGKELFEAAVQKKEGKACTQTVVEPIIEYLRDTVKCGECGARLKRKGKWRSREKWMCVNGCKCGEYISDKVLIQEILNVLTQVRDDPEILNTSFSYDTYNPSQAVIRQGKEVDRLLDQPDIKFNIVKQAILEHARMKFECCTENPAEAYTDNIVAQMQRSNLTELDMGLLKDVCAKILCNIDGTVTIGFKNSVEITSKKGAKKDERSSA